jgi:RNA polymerase sigma-70 factor (ECF subfamily)
MAVPPDMDIRALWVAIRDQRDEDALAALYDRFGPPLYRVSLGYLGNADEAAENVQNVFLHLWDKADRYDPSRGALSTWLGLLTRSKALDALRARARRQLRTPFAPEGDLSNLGPTRDGAPDPAQAHILESRRDALEAALKRLHPDQARALSLAYFHGLTQVEISQRTGWPLGTVKTHCRRGLKRLAELGVASWA